MALIGMAVYSTVENGKDEYLARTLESLAKTVDFKQHRLILSLNAFTEQTQKILNHWRNREPIIEEIIWNDTNLGTAEAINKAWKKRLPGENCVKMDDDVVIHHENWLYLMEETIRRDPNIGQVGLKRRDLMEAPWQVNPHYKSALRMLSHEPGEVWITIEEVNHVMGTLVMHSSALLDKLGYLWQPSKYAFDDSLMSLRSKLAGFKNVFLTAVDIEHIDPGTTNFQKEKEKTADDNFQKYIDAAREFMSGKRPLYYNPFNNEQ